MFARFGERMNIPSTFSSLSVACPNTVEIEWQSIAADGRSLKRCESELNEKRTWILSRGAGKKVNQFGAQKLADFVGLVMIDSRDSEQLQDDKHVSLVMTKTAYAISFHDL